MKRDTNTMKDFWDKKARENAMDYVSSYRGYDDQDPEEFWKWGSRLAERFLTESGISFAGSEKMLEIGCGVGRMTQYFARRFAEVHGLDVSEEMIAQAKENLGELVNLLSDSFRVMAWVGGQGEFNSAQVGPPGHASPLLN